jgi:hypothetical protein
VKISQASTPRLGQLTQLQRLDLKGIGLNGSEPGSLTGLFSALTQLTAFSINGHTAVSDADNASRRPELAEFLFAVGCLTGLRSLEMRGGVRCMVWESDEEDSESDGDPGSGDSESEEDPESEAAESEGADKEGSGDENPAADEEDPDDPSDSDSEGPWSDEEEGGEPPADYAPLTAGAQADSRQPGICVLLSTSSVF